MNEENGPDNPSNLVSLLSAMQKSVIAWCLYQCNNAADNKHMAVSILLQCKLTGVAHSCNIMKVRLFNGFLSSILCDLWKALVVKISFEKICGNRLFLIIYGAAKVYI